MGSSLQAVMSTGGNQGMYKHSPDQPTPYLYFQTARVRLGMISVARNCGEQPQTPHILQKSFSLQSLGRRFSKWRTPSCRKQRNIHPSPGLLPEHPEAGTVCSNTTPGEKRRQEEGEGEGMRATSSNQDNPGLFKENIFTRVGK